MGAKVGGRLSSSFVFGGSGAGDPGRSGDPLALPPLPPWPPGTDDLGSLLFLAGVTFFKGGVPETCLGTAGGEVPEETDAWRCSRV